MTEPAPPPFAERMPRQALALAAWAGSWTLLQGAMAAHGWDGRQQTLGFLGGFALVALGALAARSWSTRLLTSVPFAVTQVSLLGLATLAGVLAQGRLPFAYLGYAALWAVLAGSTLAVAWKRRPYRWSRVGFLLVHLAPALILLGGLWGRCLGLHERFVLRPGASSGVLPGTAGLRLRLDRVESSEPEPGFRLYAGRSGGGAPRLLEFPAQEGLTVTLPAGPVLQVEQALADAVESGQVVDNPAAPWAPALRVVLGLGLPDPLVGHLFLDPARCREDEPGNRFAVLFQEAWSDGLLASLRPHPPAEEKLVLSFQDRIAEHPGGLGATWPFPGFTLKVTRIFPDFAVRPGPHGQPEAYSRSDRALDPWAQVELLHREGQVIRLLLSARTPAASDRLNAPHLPEGATLRYLRLGEELQSRYVVYTRADRKVRLVDQGRVVREEALAFLHPFIVEKGLSVTADCILEHAETGFAPREGATPGQPAHPALRLKLTDPRRGTQEWHWLAAGDQVTAWGGALDLSLRERLPALRDLRCEVALVDGQGREQARQRLTLGQPLTYGGLRIGLARTPAAPGTVALAWSRSLPWPTWAGLGCLVLGSAWMFYLKPPLKRRESLRESQA